MFETHDVMLKLEYFTLRIFKHDLYFWLNTRYSRNVVLHENKCVNHSRQQILLLCVSDENSREVIHSTDM